MASPPPGDTDERGPEEPEVPAETSWDADVRVETDPAVPVPAARWQPPPADPAADIAFYDAEAAVSAATAPRRAAPLVHEAAHLRERMSGQEREAAKAYAQSLTLDPSFAPDAWALRRIFVGRG